MLGTRLLECHPGLILKNLETGLSVHIPYDHLRESIYKPLFDALNLEGCSPHSIRKSAIKWAGRCGAMNSEIRSVSRHKSEDNYMLYCEEGATEAKSCQ